MSVCKMCSVSIAGHISSLSETLEKLTSVGVFQPDELRKFYSDTTDYLPLSEENPYTEMEGSLCGILNGTYAEETPSVYFSDEEIIAYISSVTEKRARTDERITKLKADLEENEGYKSILYRFTDIDVDLAKIFACEYTVARFGSFTLSAYEKFKTNYSKKEIIFCPAKIDNDICYGVYFAPKALEEDAKRIFSSLYFQELPIKVQNGTPKEIYEKLEKYISELNQELDALQKERGQLLLQEEEKCRQMLYCVLEKKKAFDMRKYAAYHNDRFVICGWCPEEDGEHLKKTIQSVSDTECTVEVLNRKTELSPPIKLKNNFFTRPYEYYVGMYGLPCYQELDPTSFVAITYTLLFGIMFGDVGQGIVLAIIGYLMWKLKKMPLGQILVPCGISSAVFGLVYGSVFGFEELLNPMYKALGFAEKPVEVMSPATTQLIIYGAVGAGGVFVLLAMLLNIVSNAKQGKILHGILSSNGLCGMMFYLAIVSLLLIKSASVFAIPVIVITLILMFFAEPLIRLAEHKKPLEEGQALTDYFMQTFFEMFETVLGYVTNTMSFLRVGAFILVHAGMMKVVFTLAEMSSGVPYVIILVFGNALVMCLEALLVGIQVLRLEFYEMFSRFFKGEGEPYMPITANEK